MAEKDNVANKPKTASGAGTATTKTKESPSGKPLRLSPSAGTATGGGARSRVKKPSIKTVVVKKRSILKKPASAGGGAVAKKLETKGTKPDEPQTKRKKKPISKEPQPGKMVLRPLSEEQKKARAGALDKEKYRKKEEEERAQIEAIAEKEKEEQDNKKREEEKQRKMAEALRKQRQEEEAARKRAEEETAKHSDKTTDKKKSLRPRAGENRRQTKLTIFNALDETEKQQSLSALRRRRQKQNPKIKSQPQEKTHITREVIIPEVIPVVDLATRMAVRTKDVIQFLFREDIVVKAGDIIDADTAELVVAEFGHKVKRVAEADVEAAIDQRQDKEENLKPRPPVVTIMGHVDHGKTSLLDALRSASVVDGEAGGITQHIGAYQTELDGGRKITFIDTPGHAAFTAMRARGAKTTDIVVLVIAADDSVMPQTIESIDHAKAANTAIIVALNKIDLPAADPDKIMQTLLQHNVICEPLGGEVQAIPISAKTGEGLDQLREAITLQADILELKANPERPAQGVVIEARLDKGAGNVATILVQRGTLHQGDVFVAGTEWGRVRRMKTFDGKDLKNATPSSPVWITGLNSPARAGDSFDCVESEARAREIAEYRKRQEQTKTQTGATAQSIEQMFSKNSGKQELHYIVKADVQGSADAIKQALESLSREDAAINIAHAGVGEVNPSDVMLAETVKAKILMFNVKATNEAQKIAKAANILLHQFNVIYALIDEVKTHIIQALGPEQKEVPLGNAEILQLFSVGKKNIAAGCRIDEGQVKKNAHVRIKRQNVIIHEGMIESLRHFKENVSQVEAGKECGIVLENPPKLQTGDIIECFNIEQVERRLE